MWTEIPPTKKGWYWWKDKYGTLSPHPVKVSRSVVYMAEGKGCEWLAFGIYLGSSDTDTYAGEWWSEPIPVPAGLAKDE